MSLYSLICDCYDYLTGKKDVIKHEDVTTSTKKIKKNRKGNKHNKKPFKKGKPKLFTRKSVNNMTYSNVNNFSTIINPLTRKKIITLKRNIIKQNFDTTQISNKLIKLSYIPDNDPIEYMVYIELLSSMRILEKHKINRSTEEIINEIIINMVFYINSLSDNDEIHKSIFNTIRGENFLKSTSKKDLKSININGTTYYDEVYAMFATYIIIKSFTTNKTLKKDNHLRLNKYFFYNGLLTSVAEFRESDIVSNSKKLLEYIYSSVEDLDGTHISNRSLRIITYKENNPTTSKVNTVTDVRLYGFNTLSSEQFSPNSIKISDSKLNIINIHNRLYFISCSTFTLHEIFKKNKKGIFPNTFSTKPLQKQSDLKMLFEEEFWKSISSNLLNRIQLEYLPSIGKVEATNTFETHMLIDKINVFLTTFKDEKANLSKIKEVAFYRWKLVTIICEKIEEKGYEHKPFSFNTSDFNSIDAFKQNLDLHQANIDVFYKKDVNEFNELLIESLQDSPSNKSRDIHFTIVTARNKKKKLLKELHSAYSEADKADILNSQLDKLLKRLSWFYEIDYTQKYFKHFYSSYYTDFRGRIYPSTSLGVTNNKYYRSVVKLESQQSKDLPTDSDYLDDLFTEINNSKIIKDILTEYKINSRKDTYYFITCLIEIGKNYKTSILLHKREDFISLEDIVLKGINVYQTKLENTDTSIDLEDFLYIAKMRYELDSFFKKGFWRDFCIVRDATASAFQHWAKQLGIKPDKTHLLNMNSKVYYDIYTIVAKMFEESLKGTKFEKSWDKFGKYYTRSNVKLTIMTVGYGSKLWTCFDKYNDSVKKSISSDSSLLESDKGRALNSIKKPEGDDDGEFYLLFRRFYDYIKHDLFKELFINDYYKIIEKIEDNDFILKDNNNTLDLKYFRERGEFDSDEIKMYAPYESRGKNTNAIMYRYYNLKYPLNKYKSRAIHYEKLIKEEFSFNDVFAWQFNNNTRNNKPSVNRRLFYQIPRSKKNGEKLNRLKRRVTPTKIETEGLYRDLYYNIDIVEFDPTKSSTALRANFIHYYDAELVRIVIENLDVLTVHDSFTCKISDTPRLMDTINKFFGYKSLFIII